MWEINPLAPRLLRDGCTVLVDSSVVRPAFVPRWRQRTRGGRHNDCRYWWTAGPPVCYVCYFWAGLLNHALKRGRSADYGGLHRYKALVGDVELAKSVTRQLLDCRLRRHWDRCCRPSGYGAGGDGGAGGLGEELWVMIMP